MNKRQIIMASALAASALIAILGDRTPNESVSEAQGNAKNTGTRSAPPRASSGRATEEITILALTDRARIFDPSANDDPSLFGNHSWTPPPVVEPPPPPSAPPLPFTYLGKTKEGERWRIFLAKDDATLIVSEKDVIDETYRIVSVAPPTMSLLYIPLNETQTLTIE